MALNSQQAAFVFSPLENSLVLAGAGTGKTTAFIERLATLFSKQLLYPRQIFATTFTNAAAKEMRERLIIRMKEFDPYFDENDLRNIYIGTFHSLFGRILRLNIEYLKDDIRPNFTNLDQTAVNSIIRRLRNELQLTKFFDSYNMGPSDIASMISNLRENYIQNEYTFDDFNQIFANYMKDHESNAKTDLEIETIQQSAKKENLAFYNNFMLLFNRYNEHKIANNLADFTDYLVKTYKILQDNPELLAQYQQRFKYFIIDECQDMNLIQYRLIQLLFKKGTNCVSLIGDDDQSIYAFRGSRVELLDHFQVEYPDVKVYKLEQNYRCSPNIIALSNHHINLKKTHNIKTLVAAKTHSENLPIGYFELETPEQMYNTVIEDILQKGDYGNVAVLARTKRSLGEIEKYFLSNKIPYQLKTTTQLLERKDIRIFLSILKLAYNPDDNLAFTNLVDLIPRFGDAKLQQLENLSYEIGIGLFEVVEHYLHVFSPKLTKLRESLHDFAEKIIQIRHSLKQQAIHDTLEEIRKLFDLDTYFLAKKDQPSYKEHLDAIVDVARTYVPQLVHDEDTENMERAYIRKTHGANLSDTEMENLYIYKNFLDQYFVYDLKQSQNGEEQAQVVLTTIHGAKGLEWNRVYLIDVNRKTFPFMLSTSPEEKAEERRIFYVAVTRAKEQLYILYSQLQFTYQGLETLKASPYMLDSLIPNLADSIAYYYLTPNNFLAQYDLHAEVPQNKKEIKLNKDTSPLKNTLFYRDLNHIEENRAFASRAPSSYTGKPNYNNAQRSAIINRSNVSNQAPRGALAAKGIGVTASGVATANPNLDTKTKLRINLETLAAPTALNLPVVARNAAAFAEIGYQYDIINASELLMLTPDQLNILPQHQELIPIFFRDKENIAIADLGQLLTAANFESLKDPVLNQRIGKFFKCAVKLLKVVDKYETGVDLAQALEKYKMPKEVSLKIFAALKPEREQEKLLLLLDLGASSFTLSVAAQNLVQRRKEMEVHKTRLEEFAQRYQELRPQQQENNLHSTEDSDFFSDFYNADDLSLDAAAQAHSEQVYHLDSLDLQDKVYDLVAQEEEDYGQSHAAQMINVNNLLQHTVLLVGKHQYLTDPELTEVLKQAGVKQTSNPSEASLFFILSQDTPFDKYTVLIAEKSKKIILSLEQFNQLLNIH